jgi:transcriptional regulator with XRE-family HTH domain
VPPTNHRSSGRNHPPVGERLRTERHARGLSLRELADRLGVSASLISQIETGRARPSVSTLYALAGELGVSLDELLFLDPERNGAAAAATDADPGSDTEAVGDASDQGESSGPVQRARSRKRIRLASGVVWERLTTTSEAESEFLYVIYEVGGASSPEHEYQRHGGHEWGFVVSGRLTVTIGFDDFELGPGDSISIDSSTPHRLHNRGDQPVHAIWFVHGRHSAQRPAPAAAPWADEPRDDAAKASTPRADEPRPEPAR